MSDKILPDENSDYSLPGRMEESNSAYFGPGAQIEEREDDVPKSKSKALAIASVVFVLISAGFFSYYFLNQNQIDAGILDNDVFKTLEEKMVSHYGVRSYGSDHAHAALAVFVENERIDFGLEQFQLRSKYIHFENHNPYQIHKHATNVPLHMLFASIGMEITPQCIEFYDRVDSRMYCSDSENSLVFLINGEQHSDITTYEIKHNDRILISFGDYESVSAQLGFLESLEIHDVPKRNQLVPGQDISV